MINLIKKWFSKKNHNEKIIYTESVESLPVVDSVEIVSEIPEEIEEEIEIVEVSEDEEKFLSLSKEMTMNRNSIYSEIIEFIPVGIRTSVMNLNIIQRNQMFLRYLGCPKRTLHENDKMWSDLKNIDIRKMKLPEIEKAIKSLWDYLNPSENDKKKYGEVFTPFELVNEMLDKLPVEVWSNPKLKWLEPANGVGNFAIVIIKRLMIGLEGWEPDEEKRYKHIIENMIYVCELQSKNMFVWLFTIDRENKYDVNFYRESFLGKGFSDKMKEWAVEKFDVIVGNPPYQEQVGENKTKSLWDRFVKESYDILSDNGYILMVHPSGWRSLDGDYKYIQNILKGNLMYLEMHSDVDGQKVFGAATSHDWYCFSKKKISNLTKIKDQDNSTIDIDLSAWEFIPNGHFDRFVNLIAKEGDSKLNVLYSRSSYGTDKNHMKKTYSDEYKYPCVYTIIKNNTINLWWSNTDKNGHFGIPKLIWSNGMASPPTIDYDGKYGLTQFSYAIVDDISNLENIKKAMNNKDFINLMKLCYMSSGNRFDRKVLSTFKKDFWKEFI